MFSSTCCFASVGSVIFLYYLLKIFINLISTFIAFYARPFYYANKVKSLGKWAVVTGASDGIGKAYAEEFAKVGLNVCLISRTASKLEIIADELKKNHNVEVRWIAVDFTSADIYEKIEKEISDLDVGVLVNNVGMASIPDYVHEIENFSTFAADMHNVNMLSVLRVSRIVLPGMIKKKKGAIVNISSGFGVFHAPLFSLYSATKAYVVALSNGMREEYKKDNIIVQCVTPFIVATNMSRAKPGPFVVTSQAFAQAAIPTIGFLDFTAGCFMHTWQMWMFMCAPSFILNYVMLGGIKKLRDSNLRRLARKEKKKDN